MPIIYHDICLVHKLLYSLDNSDFVEYIETILIKKNNRIGIKMLASTLYLEMFFKISLPY